MKTPETPRYSIIFEGKLIEGVSRQAALDNLVQLTNRSREDLLDSLFSVKPVIAAQADSTELADQFKARFRQAGLEVVSHPYQQSHDEIVNAELEFGHYAPLESQHSKPNFVIDSLAQSEWQESESHQANGNFFVTFNGQLQAGMKRDQVMANLRSLTNSTEQQVLENLFSTVPVIICQTNNHELAKSYQQDFETAGLAVTLSSSPLDDFSEFTARSQLLVRNDRPSPPPQKKVQRFTFTLYGLAGLACASWIAIYMVIDNYLEQDVEQAIQVQLIQQKRAEKNPPPVQSVTPEKKLSKAVKKAPALANKPAKKAVAKAAEKQQKPVSPPALEKQPVHEEKPKPVPKKENKQQQKIKNEYNLQLLNWFAQFQQANQLQSRYVEGEITLRLTVARNGDIKQIEVLKSSSEELQRIVVMQLRKAKTVPGIPQKITGKEYAFDLPLRYRFN